jgi:hypothetical protein
MRVPSNVMASTKMRSGGLYPDAFPTRHYAYLNIGTRRQLTTGLHTWLYDYISSNDCRMVMTYASLREACGRPNENPKQFVDYVKDALPPLVAVGAIVKFEFAKCPHAKKPGVLVTKKKSGSS